MCSHAEHGESASSRPGITDTCLAVEEIAKGVRRARRKESAIGWLILAPTVLFVLIVFVAPIIAIFAKAVEDPSVVRNTLSGVTSALTAWDGAGVPSRAVGAALVIDLRTADPATVAEAANALNERIGGYRSLLIKTRRQVAAWPSVSDVPPLATLDARWGDPAYWLALQAATRPLTLYYVLAAIDLRQAPDGQILRAPQDRRIYLQFVGRTFWICGIVTLLCALIGYPFAYLMAGSTPGIERMLLVALLIPLWTSVLVRTAAWVIILQRHGLVNEILQTLRIINAPLTLIYNRFGVYVAMVHVLLPFMILPIYSVMKTVPPALLPAAASLGARPASAFRQVYLPLSMPGLSAGVLMTFILGLGYYVTPALVGGANDQMESGLIARFALDQANWSMAAAISLVLLVMTALAYVGLQRLLHVKGLPLQ